jgi:hypothetical protein
MRTNSTTHTTERGSVAHAAHDDLVLTTGRWVA